VRHPVSGAAYLSAAFSERMPRTAHSRPVRPILTGGAGLSSIVAENGLSNKS